jgi:hypothetical protein
LWLALCVPPDAHADRPLITDDAAVVGARRLQFEAWAYVARTLLEVPLVATFGASDWLELAVAASHGAALETGSYALRGPLFQAKALLFAPGAWPGVALASGVATPVGIGPFEPAGWDGYAYAAVTQLLFDQALALHLNLGLAAIAADAGFDVAAQGGLAAEVRLTPGFSIFGELVRGDPYDPRRRFAAAHGGVRLLPSDWLQLDATLGTTLPPLAGARGPALPWVTLGVLLLSPPLWGEQD